MLVMQGNELAVSLGFVGEVVLFSSPRFGKKKKKIQYLFSCSLPSAVPAGGVLKRSVSKTIVSPLTKPQTRSANTRDGLFYR